MSTEAVESYRVEMGSAVRPIRAGRTWDHEEGALRYADGIMRQYPGREVRVIRTVCTEEIMYEGVGRS